jgi:hypothetical protein
MNFQQKYAAEKLQQIELEVKAKTKFMEVLQAVVDGKTIQIKTGNGWLTSLDGLMFTDPYDAYRVKPDPVWRAVKTFDEAKQFLDKEVRLKGDDTNRKYVINAIGNYGMKTDCYFATQSFDKMFDWFELMDGTPIGILEDE